MSISNQRSKELIQILTYADIHDLDMSRWYEEVSLYISPHEMYQAPSEIVFERCSRICLSIETKAEKEGWWTADVCETSNNGSISTIEICASSRKAELECPYLTIDCKNVRIEPFSLTIFDDIDPLWKNRQSLARPDPLALMRLIKKARKRDR